jgi:hypothetical protein
MGHNCSGVKRTARMKRAKRYNERLAKKYAEAEGGAPSESTGVLGAVKKAGAGVAHAVGAAVHAVADTLTKKKETPTTPKA